MKPLFSLLLTFAALFFGACSTVETRIQENLSLFEALSSEQQALIKKGEVGLGFTPKMVELALGEPDRIRSRLDAKGETEIWVYTQWEGDDGVLLYTGYYHRYHRFAYPYYLGRSQRRERDQVRVTFAAGKVASIEKETK